MVILGSVLSFPLVLGHSCLGDKKDTCLIKICDTCPKKVLSWKKWMNKTKNKRNRLTQIYKKIAVQMEMVAVKIHTNDMIMTDILTAECS